MSQTRILNISRGFRLKPNQAYRAIENGACEWVELGISIRDLTLAESIDFRNKQAAVREPLEYAEIPGIKYDGKTDYNLIRQAHEFATSVI